MASKSKFFRVATEGATTDGRKIERTWIEQMAKNFKRTTYGARVWLEHMRGLYADSPFKAYGDVLAVESRTVEDGKLALFAQIEPLPELVAMNKSGQKIYTSIEVHPKFADTGEAYLVGLAVTDSPASLGTEILSFAAQNPSANPLAKRKTSPETLFSELVEFQLELEPDTPAADPSGKFSEALKAALAKFTGKNKADDDRFASVLQAFEDMGTHTSTAIGKLQAAIDQQGKAFSDLQAEHQALLKKLEATPALQHSQRPPATGGSGNTVTDC